VSSKARRGRSGVPVWRALTVALRVG